MNLGQDIFLTGATGDFAHYLEHVLPEQMRQSSLAHALPRDLLFALDIRGAGGGQWSCRWADGVLKVRRGLDAGAIVTYRIGASTFEDLLRGRQTPRKAFFEGRTVVGRHRIRLPSGECGMTIPTMLPHEMGPCCLAAADRNERLRELLALHFHPRHGSEDWLQRQERLGWKVRDRVRTLDDLWLLGPTPPADLRCFSLRAFIPRTFHRQWPRFVIGETAGASGAPLATAYRDDEFQDAFVTPFLRVAEATGFPRGEPWLWVGPSGPHIIGKVVRELARQTGSIDPFSVDFDPRWAKKLAEGSLARQRYLDHVTSQAVDLLWREEVGVLFITPPALAVLTERLTDRQREAIHGIHYGGMSLTAETVNRFRDACPRAVHLAGYGNTLFGVIMEVADAPRRSIDYMGGPLPLWMKTAWPYGEGW